uniref:Putative phosphopantothenoylcysteine decarboxylase subunit vhs3 n=1 Tax=Ixodes ricinus TaxID=34613 RepID=V5IBV2_IXORI
MQGHRQALLGTWAFLLSFCAVVHASTGNDAGRKVDIRTVLMILNGEKLYGQDFTSDTTPSLLGIDAYCLKMEFLRTGNTGLPNTLSLFYIDSSNKLKSSYWTNATLSMKVAESENSVTFTFTRANKTELMGRNVKYVLLKTLNEGYTFCSILQTSKGQPNCSYWVLVMSAGGVVPEWCRPDTIEQDCKVEIYTLTKHKECGYASEEEDEDDDDDYEESDYEEDEDEEDEYEEEDDEEDEDSDYKDEDGEDAKDEDEDEENESRGESKD